MTIHGQIKSSYDEGREYTYELYQTNAPYCWLVGHRKDGSYFDTKIGAKKAANRLAKKLGLEIEWED